MGNDQTLKLSETFRVFLLLCGCPRYHGATRGRGRLGWLQDDAVDRDDGVSLPSTPSGTRAASRGGGEALLRAVDTRAPDLKVIAT